MAASAKVYAAIDAVLSSALDTGTAEFHHRASLNPVNEFTNGTGANQISKVFTDTRTLGSSATENLDLAGGLTDALGTTITFTGIKAILITAASGNTNDVVVGGAGSNTFLGVFADASDKINVKPGGAFLWTNPSAAGAAVTASTGDILLVANSSSGSSVTYTIVILGIA